MNQYKIKYIRLDRIFNNYRQEYIDATEDVLNSGIVVGGPHVNAFEENISNITHRKHAISVSSCTDAIFFILKACGIGIGDEVITTSFSFIATASAIARTGAKPVFVDIDEHYHLLLKKVAAAKTIRTKAVLAVNLLGDCVNFNDFEVYCKTNNLILIEDAAQSLGARFADIPSGKLGLASALSFSPMKPVPCFGTGGAIVTDDEKIAETCRLLRRHGITSNGTEQLGYNSVIPSDKAAQLNISLKYREIWLEERAYIAHRYKAELQNIYQLELPKTRTNALHCWHKYIIKTSLRDELKGYLQNKGIETQIHYKNPLTNELIFKNNSNDLCLHAEQCSNSCLSLPIYPYLSDNELWYIIDSIKQFYSSNKPSTCAPKNISENIFEPVAHCIDGM